MAGTMARCKVNGTLPVPLHTVFLSGGSFSLPVAVPSAKCFL